MRFLFLPSFLIMLLMEISGGKIEISEELLSLSFAISNFRFILRMNVA